MSAAAGLLQGLHAAIAMRRDEPHWLLNEVDAKRYGQALANALRHLPVKTTQKALDFSVLVFCVVEMETPRIYRSRQLAEERARPRPRGPAQVFQFHSPQPPPPQPQPAPAPQSQSQSSDVERAPLEIEPDTPSFGPQ